MRGRRSKLAYSADVPMVFQDPYSSINPAYRVSHGIARGMKLHRGDLSRSDRGVELNRVLDAVGLVPVSDTRRRFPYELSGGQRQRVGFAQALALKPKLIVADEPVSMLDVSIRVGVLNLMGELREREGVSFLYITHDVASARYLADRVVVMYAGHLVEEGPTEDVLQRPKHPYTQLLVSAVPDPRAELGLADARDVGEPPKVVDPKPGCRSATAGVSPATSPTDSVARSSSLRARAWASGLAPSRSSPRSTDPTIGRDVATWTRSRGPTSRRPVSIPPSRRTFPACSTPPPSTTSTS